MSKNIQVLAFQFLGGNRSELDKRSNRLASREWQDIVEKLASTVPNVFPTCPGAREIEQIKGPSFINVPMDEPGMRAHTVYFAVNAEGGRSFFNVLCFAYQCESVSLRELATLSSTDWWGICNQLAISDVEIAIPENNTEVELPEWDGKKALFFRVPDSRGGVLSGEFEDWREILKQASPPPYQPLPYSETKPFPWKKCICIALAVLCVLGMVLGAILYNWKKPTPSDPPMSDSSCSAEPITDSTPSPESEETQTDTEGYETEISTIEEETNNE